jgi:hypothetical protein
MPRRKLAIRPIALPAEPDFNPSDHPATGLAPSPANKVGKPLVRCPLCGFARVPRYGRYGTTHPFAARCCGWSGLRCGCARSRSRRRAARRRAQLPDYRRDAGRESWRGATGAEAPGPGWPPRRAGSSRCWTPRRVTSRSPSHEGVLGTILGPVQASAQIQNAPLSPSIAPRFAAAAP